MTPASFEPAIDYVVTKVPRFTFEKFSQVSDRITTQMKSVGEVMAIGRTFKESFQKALRGLETGMTGLNPVLDSGDTARGAGATVGTRELSQPGSGPDPGTWRTPSGACARRGRRLRGDFGASIPWFLAQIEDLVASEAGGDVASRTSRPRTLWRLKRDGFSDERLAELAGCDEDAVREAAAANWA